MTGLMHNIDGVRARIMELESATVFDQRAWAEVLIALTDRPNARADAARRMETAKQNAQCATCVVLENINGVKTRQRKLSLADIVSFAQEI